MPHAPRRSQDRGGIALGEPECRQTSQLANSPSKRRVPQAIEPISPEPQLRQRRQQLAELSLLPAQAEGSEHQRLADGIIDEQQVGADLRTLTFGLNPPVLYHAGLTPALRWLIGELRRHFRLNMRLVDDGSAKWLGSQARTIVFRTVRELLSNVVKHAKAGSVKISISGDGEHLIVRVCDDGAGMSGPVLSSVVGGGPGLSNVLRRLATVGGGLRIESAAACGTRATIVLPLDQRTG